MSYFSLDDQKIAATQRDGITRLGRYRDTNGDISMHVIQLVDGIIQTTLIDEWSGPEPKDPTQDDIDLAVAEIEMQQASRDARSSIRRQQIIDLVSTTVGMKVKDLSLSQLKSILVVLFDDRGIVDETMSVRPIDEWLVRRRQT